jgi:predicted nucleic acid-binding protein
MPSAIKVYLDLCCLNRLMDDQEQPRIHQEAEAVERVFKRIQDGAIQWISSDVLFAEIVKNPRVERKQENAALLAHATKTIEVSGPIAERARKLQPVGYGAFDALHLACAEASGADVLLTTDDAFIRRASRGDGSPQVDVRNPLFWSREVLE